MGMSLTGIHVFGTAAPEDAELPFRSFSAGWFTCVNDFSETDPERTYEAARRISRATDAPVLYFNVFDSEAIWFVFFRGGKVAAKYSDDEFSANKGLYGIPALVGYESEGKRRLSDILSCADTDRKIALLEEYFGVCLTFVPEMLDEPGGTLPRTERAPVPRVPRRGKASDRQKRPDGAAARGRVSGKTVFL